MAHNNQSVRHFNDQRSCAHAWAHGHCQNGYASNFFFEGKTIYSFGKHFPIATIDGDRVFFTEKTYSNTTAHHMNTVLSAISHKKVIYVQYVPSEKSIADSFPDDQNIPYWLTELYHSADAVNANPRKKSLKAYMNRVFETINTFVLESGITPKGRLAHILADPSLASIVASHKKDLAEKEKREKQRIARLKTQFKKDLTCWESGELNKMPFYNLPNGEGSLAYLRLNTVKQRIETSKGIEVPMAMAQEFWKFILSQLPAGCVNPAYSILGFQVDQISTEFIKAGCHTIPMFQAIKIARLLNWEIPGT